MSLDALEQCVPAGEAPRKPHHSGAYLAERLREIGLVGDTSSEKE